MHTEGQINFPTAAHHGGLPRRMGRAMGREVKGHPLRWTFRLLILAYFGSVLANQQIATGQMQPVFFWCFFVYCCLMFYRLIHTMWDKGQQVEDWAIVQKEHQAMQELTEDTAEDLEKLLNYHMKYGNIKAADRISQKLLAVTESGPQALEPEVQPAAAASPPATGGLPNWLQGQVKQEPPPHIIKLKPAAEPAPRAEEQEETEKAAQKLPDWMK